MFGGTIAAMGDDDRFFKRILELVDAEPFQAFDIRKSDGRAYFVDSPDYFARSREGGGDRRRGEGDGRGIDDPGSGGL